MDGILLINKEKGYTSFDVVKILKKELNTKKIGHFGTLDPLATGLLVIGIGKYTKFQKTLDHEDKTYNVTVLLGKSTNTYDITGNVLKTSKILEKDYLNIKEQLQKFKGTYLQEVPIYSAVKVNGEKLYNYARNNKKVTLPKKEVTLKEISNINISNNYLTFTCIVSKGFYIRSLINDLSNITNIPMCMFDLKRTKIDSFLLEDAFTIDDIINNNYKLFDISKIFNYKLVEVDTELYRKIINGVKLDNIYKDSNIIFTKDNKYIALYKLSNDNKLVKIFFF